MNLIRSQHLDRNKFFDYYSKNLNKIDYNQILVRMTAPKDLISKSQGLKNQTNRIFTIVNVCENMSPLSKFPRVDVKNYQEHFLKKYCLETNVLEQPLIELKQIETNMNFILRNEIISDKNKSSVKNKIVEHFIGEHFIVLPLGEKYLFKLTMLPAIFHRMITLKKAEHLKLIIEKSIIQNLDIKKVLIKII